MCMLQAVFPAIGVIQLRKWAHLSLILAEVINDITLATEAFGSALTP